MVKFSRRTTRSSLYFLTLTGQKQIQITTPPENEGDYNPIFLSAIHKITWLRKSDIANEKADLYIANSDGSDAKIWVKNIESYSFFSSNH